MLVYAAFAVPAAVLLIPVSLYQAPAGRFGFDAAQTPFATLDTQELARRVLLGGVLLLVSGLVSIALAAAGFAGVTSIALEGERESPAHPADGFRVIGAARGRLAALVAIGLVVWVVACSVGLGVAVGVLAGSPGFVSMAEVGGRMIALGVLVFAASIGGLIVMARLSLALAALIAERRGAVDALRRSWELTSGSTLRIIGILILAGIIASSVATLTSWFLLPSLMEGFLSGSVWPTFWLTMVSVACSAVLGPIVPVMLAVVYRDVIGTP